MINKNGRSRPRMTASLLSRCLVALILLVGALPVHAQPMNLTPEQMAQLQALTPAQRQALLDSVGNEPVQQQALEPAVEVMPRQPQNDGPSAIERNVQTNQAPENLADRPARVNRGELDQFGYNLFAGSPTTFAPASDIPVPTNYVMGPGDNVIIQLYGQQNVTHDLVVTREGTLLFPEIGPVNVAGLTFDELRQQIDDIVSNQLIGQRATVNLGSLRSIRIFILGEAYRPGSYTVSSLSTMTNALFVSGGITNVGSLRNVQLRRQGETVAVLDLYDLLLAGDTSADQRLMPDDVLFIPPVGPTVAIAGEVIRPAIYELRTETTAAEVLALAGGLLPTAYLPATKVERIDEQGLRTLIDINLAVETGQDMPVRNGDLVQINPILDRLENVVLTEGHLQRPGGFQWREGLRVSDVIGSVAALRPNPDLEYALLVREEQPQRISRVLKLELGTALNNSGSGADLLLQPRDRIITFGAVGSREQNLQDLLNELNTQARFDNPAAVVTVEGAVRFPGEYPYLENMTVGDMVNSAGGLLENADADYALVVRKADNQGTIAVESAITGALSLESTKATRRGDTLLVFNATQPRQNLLSDTIEQLEIQADSAERSKVVRASGQVRFEGEYPLYPGMTVEDLLRAAGGFTESAQTAEAELTRYTVQTGAGRSVDHTEVNLTTEPGRNLTLREFDNLVVRQLPNWVAPETIQLSGEVVSPGTYSIAKGDTLSSVIGRAGGLTMFADANASILLRAELRERERELLRQYEEELRADIAAVALEENQASEGAEGQTLEIGEGLLQQVEEAEPLGRLVIDLPSLLTGADSDNVIVRNGDQLFIPRTRQEISILGEVNYPTSHLYDPRLSPQDYINLSGGLTQRADAKRTYVIKANGEVAPIGNSRWFFERRAALGPGDTIVVPFDVEPTNYLITWTSISQILFNLATSVLAINSVQN